VLGYPVSEIVWLVLWIIAGGVVTGVLAGLFGIGGGGVIVPVLYEVFGALHVPDVVRMQLCVGTSLAIIVPTTVRSYLAHKKKGAVIPQVVRVWTLPAIGGVLIGSVAATFAPAAVFKVAFVIFAALLSAKMLLARDRWNLGKELPGRAALSVYGFITGLFSSRSTASRCNGRWRPPPASACRSPLLAPSATRLPAGRIGSNCRRCRSASSR
jgi:uncharacterized membrane protein YfcA